ncbi:hypothetical protein V8C37DRAFT_373954 [Trichoderma ceciliae]
MSKPSSNSALWLSRKLLVPRFDITMLYHGFCSCDYSRPLYSLFLPHIISSVVATLSTVHALTNCTLVTLPEQRMIMSPDAVSLLFPDRPIRPLPKRRLRERLSPEVANSIKYPSYIHDHIPLFYYPSYATGDDNRISALTLIGPTIQHHRDDSKRSSTLRRNGAAMATVMNEELRGAFAIRSSSKIQSMVIQSAAALDPLRQAMELQPIPSTASSVDGYESFENTNNKKKRKIPTTGDSLASNGLSLGSDINALSTSMGARSPVNEVHSNKTSLTPAGFSGNSFHVPGSQGLSGSGRGRLGRSNNGRSPLRALSDGGNIWSSRSKAASSQWTLAGQIGSGIISNAIATAEKAPLQGQENGSLLQPHVTTYKAMPASTQFTFTCKTQTPGAIQWPGRSASNAAPTPSLQSLPVVAPPGPSVHQGSSSKQVNRLPDGSTRKTRSRLERELVVAARNRRQIARENYFHSILDSAEIWICEFCEYERIFGEPPRTLIRDYEIKDRRHRQDEADRKRLLEKAKAKSRKGKKNSKVSTKGGHTADHISDQPHAARPANVSPTLTNERGRSTHSDDGYEDDYEYDYSDALPGHIPNAGGTHADSLPPVRAKT